MFSLKAFSFLTIFILLIIDVKSETEALPVYEGTSVYNNYTDPADIIKLKIDDINHTVKDINLKTNEIQNQLEENLKNILNKFDENFENSKCNKNFVQNKPKTQTLIYDEHFNCLENCKPMYNIPLDCDDAMPTDAALRGHYLLNISNSGLASFYANCVRRDNQTWTVIQRRSDNSVDFYRNWSDYKNGFGDLNNDFWLGLERLYHLTENYSYELYIRIKDKGGNERFAKYRKFSIANEGEKYELSIGQYSGNAGDSMKRHNGKKFSTYDNHNDDQANIYETCEDKYRGAWWFDRCFASHLNGPFDGLWSKSDSQMAGIAWLPYAWELKFSEMMIRRI